MYLQLLNRNLLVVPELDEPPATTGRSQRPPREIEIFFAEVTVDVGAPPVRHVSDLVRPEVALSDEFRPRTTSL